VGLELLNIRQKWQGRYPLGSGPTAAQKTNRPAPLAEHWPVWAASQAWFPRSSPLRASPTDTIGKSGYKHCNTHPLMALGRRPGPAPRPKPAPLWATARTLSGRPCGGAPPAMSANKRGRLLECNRPGGEVGHPWRQVAESTPILSRPHRSAQA